MSETAGSLSEVGVSWRIESSRRNAMPRTRTESSGILGNPFGKQTPKSRKIRSPGVVEQTDQPRGFYDA